MSEFINNLPILDDILKRRKRKYRKKLNISIAFWGGLGAVLSTYAFFRYGGLATGLGCMVIPMLVIAFSLLDYSVHVNAERLLAHENPGWTMEKLEYELQKCKKIDEFVFMSDKYIFDLDYLRAIELSDIQRLKKCFDYETVFGHYLILVERKQHCRKHIGFSSKKVRNTVFDRLTAMELPEKKWLS